MRSTDWRGSSNLRHPIGRPFRHRFRGGGPGHRLPRDKLTQWLTSKAKDDRAKALLNRANEILLDARRWAAIIWLDDQRDTGRGETRSFLLWQLLILTMGFVALFEMRVLTSGRFFIRVFRGYASWGFNFPKRVFQLSGRGVLQNPSRGLND